jgi:hypothetical protein
MWFEQPMKSLGDLVAGLGQTVFRFYAETEVGTTRRLFFLSPVLNNDLDTDGSGITDLRVRIVPHVALPPDGLTVTFQRLGAGVPGVSARIYIGIDGGIWPVGTPPPTMQFAFVGFDGDTGSPPPQELQVAFEQRGTGTTHLALDVSATNVPGPGVRLRAGLLTSAPAVAPAERIPGSGTTIRTANPAAATQLTDARLRLGLPSGATLTLTTPVHIAVDTTPAGTTVQYAAPVPLAVSADVTSRGPGNTRLLASTPLMPAHVDVSVAPTEAFVVPDAPLRLDLRGTGLPAPLPGLTNATLRVTLPGAPLRAAWGPPPVLIDVGLRPGAPGDLALALNAELLTGDRTVESLLPPPQPRQALVAEYDDGRDLWLAVNALGGLRVMREVAGTRTTVQARLTLDRPLADEAPPVPPRSVRVSARTANRLTADARASGLDPDAGTRGTLSGQVDLDDRSLTAQVSGRLRHLRAVYDDGRARTEAWTLVTPATLDVTARYGDGDLDVTVAPRSAVAVNGDRVAYAGGAVGPFARLFARLLLGAPLRVRYATTPRQPTVRSTAAVGSTTTVHLDNAATAFPPELVGMALRYESGVNAGAERTITAVAPGELRTDAFPSAPTAGDGFVVVSLDALLDATESLPQPSTRRGVSAVVSAASARDHRRATRVSPQVVRQTTRRWVPLVSAPGPDELDAVAARVEGVLRAQLPPPVGPGQGALALDLDLDPTRLRRSLRYAEDRRWILPESVRTELAETRLDVLRPVPRMRALLADAPDTVVLRTAAGVGTSTYFLSRVGGGEQGWVWAVIEQSRWNGQFAGLGVISLDISALPRRVGLVLADPLADVRRRTPPGDIMWTPPSAWLAPSSQTVLVGGGDLRVDRIVYASFWPGRSGRSDGTAQSYPMRDLDQWDLTTVSVAHLHDTGAADQRITIWSLDQRDWDDPDHRSGIAVEAIGLNADLDLDRYRALLPPALRNYTAIRWTKTTELQLQGYIGAWALTGESGGPIPGPDYERPTEDVGFWLVRAINQIPGVGDAYFGNTSGNINGRQRLYQ